MNGKNLLITKEAHKILKEYCLKNDLKLTGTASKILIAGIKNLQNEK